MVISVPFARENLHLVILLDKLTICPTRPSRYISVFNLIYNGRIVYARCQLVK